MAPEYILTIDVSFAQPRYGLIRSYLVNDTSFRVTTMRIRIYWDRRYGRFMGIARLSVGYGFWIGRLTVIVVNLERLNL